MDKGSVYSYVYLPTHVKPWALSCLEHLDGNEDIKFIKYEVTDFNKFGISNEFKFSTYKHQVWCFCIDSVLSGLCLTSRVDIPIPTELKDCYSFDSDYLLTYLTLLKNDTWVICQCLDFKGIKEDNWPCVHKLTDTSAKDYILYFKTKSDLLSFQNDTKDNFEFEELD